MFSHHDGSCLEGTSEMMIVDRLFDVAVMMKPLIDGLMDETVKIIII